MVRNVHGLIPIDSLFAGSDDPCFFFGFFLENEKHVNKHVKRALSSGNGYSWSYCSLRAQIIFMQRIETMLNVAKIVEYFE